MRAVRTAVSVVHDTADGLIYCQAERHGRKWLARHWGDELDGREEFRTLRAANEFVVTSFREMFPEHLCTPKCRKNVRQKA